MINIFPIFPVSTAAPSLQAVTLAGNSTDQGLIVSANGLQVNNGSNTAVEVINGAIAFLKAGNLTVQPAADPTGNHTLLLPIVSDTIAVQGDIPAAGTLQSVTTGAGNNKTTNGIVVQNSGLQQTDGSGAWILQNGQLKFTSGGFTTTYIPGAPAANTVCNIPTGPGQLALQSSVPLGHITATVTLVAGVGTVNSLSIFATSNAFFSYITISIGAGSLSVGCKVVNTPGVKTVITCLTALGATNVTDNSTIRVTIQL